MRHHDQCTFSRSAPAGGRLYVAPVSDRPVSGTKVTLHAEACATTDVKAS